MYVCIENNAIVSIMEYEPNVPSSIAVVKITDKEYKTIQDRTHYFDVSSKSVISLPSAVLLDQQNQKDNLIARNLLTTTDWKVMRHIREKALGLTTTLSDSEYIVLEQQRHTAASSIK